MAEKKAEWTGRLGFIMASLGMAFGTGNVWRFPREAAANDGGAFLIAFLVANLVWAVPLLMIEMIMGKTTRLGTSGAFRNWYGKQHTWMGAYACLVCLLITCYYSIVMGWALKYLVLSVTGALAPGANTDALWTGFQHNPAEVIAFNIIAWIICAWIILRGVQDGLELMNKMIVPSIVVILAVIMFWGITKPHAMMGMEYLFAPKFSSLANGKIWLHAFTQAAWSIGAGWGLMVTYSRYMKEDEDIAANAMVIAFADSGSSMLAAMAVLPLVFVASPNLQVAMDSLHAGNTGFTFIYLTKFFPTLPLGSIMAALFFFALAISALGSLLAQTEVIVANIMDWGVSRKKAALWTAGVCIVGGLPSCIWPKFMDNQDFVWGVGLLFAGVFFAMAAMRAGLPRVRKMISDQSYINVGKWFDWCVYSFPVQLTIVAGWWVWQSYTWYPQDWFNPLRDSSVGTLVLQVGILIIACKLLNDWFAKKVQAPYVCISEEGR